MAPPSARQLAPPRSVKFSMPLAPSISVSQPAPLFIEAQPARQSAVASEAAAREVSRFILSPVVVGRGLIATKPGRHKAVFAWARGRLARIAVPCTHAKSLTKVA